MERFLLPDQFQGVIDKAQYPTNMPVRTGLQVSLISSVFSMALMGSGRERKETGQRPVPPFCAHVLIAKGLWVI
jgi:hypothetical protein